MKLRDMFEKEGLSLAGIVLVAFVVLLLFGVMFGNWIMGMIAGPSSYDLPVADIPNEITPIQQDVFKDHIVVESREVTLPNESFDEESMFTVQVGAFNSIDNAQKLRGQLENSGFSAWVTDTQPYKVHLGVFDNRQEAETMRDEVEKKGFDAFIAH